MVGLISCQEEVIEINEPAPEEAFNSDSQVAQLILRVAQRDGSEDNIISGGSCFSVELPVTVIVNDQEVEINSAADYSTIERIIDQFDDDEDDISFIYPITIVLDNHDRVIINSDDVLEEYIEECVEDGFDDDIECIDFVYPLQVSLYDTENQSTNALTIHDDEELYELLENLDDDVLVSIDFPVTMTFYDGTEIIVNDNQELQEAIDNAEDTCDEDDDLDFDDDDVDDTELSSVIADHVWVITYYFNEDDQTALYSQWTFTFNNDMTISATSDENNEVGFWNTYGDDGVLEVEIDFDNASELLDELSEDWKVINFSDDIIQLENIDDSEPVYLTLEKN